MIIQLNIQSGDIGGSSTRSRNRDRDTPADDDGWGFFIFNAINSFICYNTIFIHVVYHILVTGIVSIYVVGCVLDGTDWCIFWSGWLDLYNVLDLVI